VKWRSLASEKVGKGRRSAKHESRVDYAKRMACKNFRNGKRQAEMRVFIRGGVYGIGPVWELVRLGGKKEDGEGDKLRGGGGGGIFFFDGGRVLLTKLQVLGRKKVLSINGEGGG